ncbi:MAG: DNA polymerase III subunit beta, partial [Bacteroidaceae bacterium]|nr:DNA polymerase III subunit beta [Bacteroidaceae bacterium]
MNFIVSSSLLTSHLQAISRVINSKNTIPVLDCFLFEIEGNILKLTERGIKSIVIIRS